MSKAVESLAATGSAVSSLGILYCCVGTLALNSMDLTLLGRETRDYDEAWWSCYRRSSRMDGWC
jgi:hypothetical protein